MSLSRDQRGRGKLAAGMTAAGVLVSMVGMSCTTVAPASARSPAADASGSPGAPGAQLWARTYYPAGDIDAAAASPDGSAVFVTGAIRKNGIAYYATIGYDAGTGAELWVSRFNVGGTYGAPGAIAISPDSGTVFVVGQSSSSGAAYATIAYNASTGRQLWVSRHNWVDRALVMSPDGKTVYVTGYAFSANLDYVTIAYNAATGARRWLARYNGRANGNDVAFAVTTGTQQWMSTYNGPGQGDDNPLAVDLSPDGRTLYVTGSTTGATTWGFTTMAYRT